MSRVGTALISVVAASYLLGCRPGGGAKLIRALGITSLSKSQVLRMAEELDEQVEAFRTRPLDTGPAPSAGPMEPVFDLHLFCSPGGMCTRDL